VADRAGFRRETSSEMSVPGRLLTFAELADVPVGVQQTMVLWEQYYRKMHILNGTRIN
jgi:hypothetical protein